MTLYEILSLVIAFATFVATLIAVIKKQFLDITAF